MMNNLRGIQQNEGKILRGLRLAGDRPVLLCGFPGRRLLQGGSGVTDGAGATVLKAAAPGIIHYQL